MQRAIDYLKKNADKKEIPVSAVVVKDGQIISAACNRKETENDVTAHAEILALREAAGKLGRWRLEDCVMYVTLEPCPMCAWAILQARLKAVYFGSYDVKYGAFGSVIDLREFSDIKPGVYGGIMEKECDDILREFFKRIR